MALPRLHYTRVARASVGSGAATFLAAQATILDGAGWTVEVGTSSFADMISCQPPNSGSGTAVQDMRIVFSASSSSLTRQMLSPDSYLTHGLHVGVAKGITSEQLGDGTATGNPFGGGTFSGFWRTASGLSSERFVTVGVSVESLCLMVDTNSDSTNCQPCFAGAIIDPQDSDYAESNGRLIGMATGVNQPALNWLAQSAGIAGWLLHENVNARSHFGYFEPGGSDFITLDRWVGGVSNAMFLTPSASFAHPSGKKVLVPIAVCHQSSRTDLPLGYLRGMMYWRDDTLGRVVFHDPVGAGDPGDFEDAVLVVGMNPHGESDAVGLVMKDLRDGA